MARKLGILGSVGISLGLLGTAQTGAAQVPPYLTEQGRLFDMNNAPVTEETTFTFTFYAAASGGAALWSETDVITPDDGFFSAVLGDGTPFPGTLFTGSVVYLGIRINAGTELSPRQGIASVPYALLAGNVNGNITPNSVWVDGAQIIDETGQWVGDPTGLIGPTGPVGATGAPGAPGVTGAPGAPGVTGAPGGSGVDGVTGAKGATGATGAPGGSGVDGVTGAKGATGATGAPGGSGVDGVTGAKGATGATGGVGAPGTNGVTGPVGATGAPGGAGVTGAKGATGATGATGPAGAPSTWSAITTLIGPGTTSAVGDIASDYAICAAGRYVTGGGCAIGGDDTVGYRAVMKSSYPTAANEWYCACEAWDAGSVCSVTAYARCSP